MAKRVKSHLLDSREARKNLTARDKPYYGSIDRGVHLGYRKGKRSGRWVVRVYAEGDYTVKTFAQADDVRDADGTAVLDFWQAQARAREMATEDQRIAAGIETPSGRVRAGRKIMRPQSSWPQDYAASILPFLR